MPQSLPEIHRLPHALYRAQQVRELDRVAIEEQGIPGRLLMQRAGAAAFELLNRRWPDARNLVVLCGIGNNGGDGYVVARLAMERGMGVRLLQLGDPKRLTGDALEAANAFVAAGGEVVPFEIIPPVADVIVDGVFGTGLEREVGGIWRDALEQANLHPAPILALDLPSGVHADTGRVLGVAIKAEATITFIGLKQGMFTADGPNCCGDILFNALAVPATVYRRQMVSARRLDWSQQVSRLDVRSRAAHKGDFGHVLVVGGGLGCPGAPRMAAEGAARCGAGLVSVATLPEYAPLLAMGRPELMCRGVLDSAELEPLLKRASVIAIGPGLGQDRWARALFAKVLQSRLPLVVDADALNLLAAEPLRRENWVLTPHPGEAARLLNCSTAEIQEDRFKAIERLQRAYGGVVLLKGAGTLIADSSPRPVAICSEGNPGMASGGMGDLLTGLVAGFIAQGAELEEAASMGACLHGAAADRAAEGGERGMLAMDLMPQIRGLLNPEILAC